jgi:NAD(P)H-dependent flavin oxidoreductase YrpB (nitropropane dioxygenase family)
VQTEFARRLGIEFPIFAFTHCRDVVAAVTNAGGFGVLGALGFSPEQLELELRWFDDEHVGGKPYGVDVIIPQRYEGMGEKDAETLQRLISSRIPAGHRDFARRLLADAGVPELPAGTVLADRLMMTEVTSRPLIDVALRHPNVRLIANALGTPPAEVIEQVQRSGRLIGALCGHPRHARRHAEAGLDFIVAQGGEGGGHAGEIGSIVLWPDVIEIAGDIPVLAAGGIGTGRQMAAALAMGAQGVWCGSIWLTVDEAETPPASRQSLLRASSGDTVRSRSFTGKPVRMLRNAWTNAWDAPGNPESLGAPLQMMVAGEAMVRAARHPDQAQDVMFSPVGQIVGRMNQPRSSRDLILEIVQDYLDAVERLNRLQPVDL